MVSASSDTDMRAKAQVRANRSAGDSAAAVIRCLRPQQCKEHGEHREIYRFHDISAY